MIIFNRSIEPKIKELLFRGRAILIFGPRQAGKTTLAKKLLVEFGEQGEYFNCDTLAVRNHFSVGEPDKLKTLVGNRKIVVFDEAQTIQNIGSILKVFIDTYPEVQIITTGSSSFDLANKINEPLTGRSFEFVLYPLSISEIRSFKKIDEQELHELMRLGSYPAVVGEDVVLLRENLLKNIATNYLYKDIFVFESVRNSQLFEDLVKLLAFQIGSTVSVNELSRELGASRLVIEKYIRLLEQVYIIKKVRSFSRNHRNELKKSFKVYFIDTGVRNIVTGLPESDMNNRSDKGALFENFFFMERLKENSLETFPSQIYFWRTTTGYEIDFIESRGQSVQGYECKWKDGGVSFNHFLKLYPEAKTKIVRPGDFLL